MTAPKTYTKAWGDSIESRLKALEPVPPSVQVWGQRKIPVPRVTLPSAPDGDGFVVNNKPCALANTIVRSDKNACFAAPVAEGQVVAFILRQNCDFIINAGVRNNQYASRVSTPGSIDDTDCLFDNSLVTPPEEREMCDRVVSCNGGVRRYCTFRGGRVSLGTGPADEQVDYQPCVGLRYEYCLFDILWGGPNALVLGKLTTGLVFYKCRFICPQWVIAMWETSSVLFHGCEVSRDGLVWGPMLKTSEHCKQPESKGLVIK